MLGFALFSRDSIAKKPHLSGFFVRTVMFEYYRLENIAREILALRQNIQLVIDILGIHQE